MTPEQGWLSGRFPYCFISHLQKVKTFECVSIFRTSKHFDENCTTSVTVGGEQSRKLSPYSYYRRCVRYQWPERMSCASSHHNLFEIFQLAHGASFVSLRGAAATDLITQDVTHLARDSATRLARRGNPSSSSLIRDLASNNARSVIERVRTSHTGKSPETSLIL